MAENPLWIGEDEAGELLGLQDAIEALAGVHRLYAQGEASNMVKTHVQAGSSNLHAVGAVIAGEEIAGTKTWIHTAEGAQPLLILFSPRHGSVLAVIEAFGLGKKRTGATAALATRLLARPESSVLALVGTGKQAIPQAEAVAAVAPIELINVSGRDPDRRRACVEGLRERVEAEVRDEPSLEAALAPADVVTLITRADEPFVDAPMIPAGAHVNGVGAILPDRRELTVEAVAGFDLIAVDSLPQARSDSGELRAAVDAERIDWDQVTELGQLVAADRVERGADQVTLFKAMGVGIADVALGAEVLRRARRCGAGAPIPLSNLQTTK